MALLFLIYEDSIYKWSCETESNSASCYFVAKNAERNGWQIEREKYYLKSCNLNYGLSCWELAKFYQQQGKIEEATSFRKKACSMDVKELCEKPEKSN
jgi:hypothetical protein